MQNNIKNDNQTVYRNKTKIIKMEQAELKEQHRKLKYCEAIREALDQSMARDSSVFIIGEGVPDPKGIFGTTLGLQKKYGEERVMDMPVSENGMTGACIGAALTGLRPILTHQRVDFSLLSLDQIINNAAKWHYMFGGQLKVPLVIKMIIGQGWGQGAQHSQNLQALFFHIPGLKVVMPSNAYDAKGLLLASIEDNNPVIFIEHRWLHNLSGYVPEEYYTIPLGKGKIVRPGKDLTLVSTSPMIIEAVKAIDFLKSNENYYFTIELIDIRTLKPLDDEIIINSVKKTGKLLVLDSGYCTGGFAGEVIAKVTENAFAFLKVPPQRITLPDVPTPTSPGLSQYYYPTYKDIVRKILEIFNIKETNHKFPEEKYPHDVPDPSFTGPF